MWEWMLLGSGSALAGFVCGFKVSPMLAKYTKLYSTAMHIPASIIDKQIPFRARVIKVVDSDNMRVQHMPLLTKTSKQDQKLSEWTIHVRLMGVDAPESASFGMPAQQGSNEAKQYLNTLVSDRIVQVKPLRIDQYHRLIGSVESVPKSLFLQLVMPKLLQNLFQVRKNVSVEMVRSGWATVYTQAGAEYDGKLKEMQRLEEKARRRKVGMWAYNQLSPAEHKKLHK
jgi:endonuclease YncB( thermonuclease family)